MIKFLSFVSCLVVCAGLYAGDTIATTTEGTQSVLVNAPAIAVAATTNCNCNDGCCEKRERVFSRSRTHAESVTCQGCQQVKEKTDTVETSRKRLNGKIIKRSRSRTSVSVQ